MLMFLPLKLSLIAGSACCSSGAFFPSIVSTGDRAQIGTSFTGASVIGTSDSKSNSTFLNDDEYDRSFQQTIFGGLRLSDQWQMGARLGWHMRDKQVFGASNGASGIGDSHFFLTYEPLTNFSVTASILVPTAENVHESKESLQTDAFGRGLWVPGISFVYTYVTGLWDIHAESNVRFSAGRTFNRPLLGDLDVSHSWGLSALTGVGYQWGESQVRTGLSVGAHWDQGFTEKDRFQSRSLPARLAWDVIADLNVPLSSDIRLGLSYKDQTLLGPTQNSELSRSLTLLLSKSWSL